METQYCECGSELELLEIGETLDRYDNKMLVEVMYYCPDCNCEYCINEELEVVE